ncbi:MAG: hypothetical protein KGL96_00490 [Hyphomicrobiales bacterium]|nr:hypothetical protein [Hyphomicrobiales bacterium]
MIVAQIFNATLLVAVATGPALDSGRQASFSAQEKAAATEPLVRSATDCIVHAVVTDPRYGAQAGNVLGDLIVASMRPCLTSVRAMIDAYDRYYGDGTGEAFFMGPYLDVLPKAVIAGAKDVAR